jgi:hypothetical protein
VSEIAPPKAASRGGFMILTSLACWSTGNCVAVGRYDNARGAPLPLVATETHGVWSRASELALPAGANTTAVLLENAGLTAVGCTNAGTCTAVGNYTPASGYDVLPMVTSYVHGTWTRPAPITPPSASGTLAELSSIACASSGDCAAVGQYANNNGLNVPLVATETSEAWEQARTLKLPAGANVPANPDVQNGLVCVTYAGQGNYVASGFYGSTPTTGSAMVATAVPPPQH